MSWLSILGRCVVVIVLAACAVSLHHDLDAARARLAAERVQRTRSERLSVTSLTGVSAAGHRVEALPSGGVSSGVGRWVALGLREASWDSDIGYWTQVMALLPAPDEIEIVAYCDTSECTERLRVTQRRPPFEVVALGEVTTSQAVAAADARGEYIVLDHEAQVLKRAPWRDGAQEPLATSEDIVR